MDMNNTNRIKNARRVHMIGIGGVGMSALARVLKHRGYEVSGSDALQSPTTRDLCESGIPVVNGVRRQLLLEADLVVYSSAISGNDPEIILARRSGVALVHRAEVLAGLLSEAGTSVGITGTHGKTTTTSMVSFVLNEMGKRPTCLIGGDSMNLGSNAILGRKDLCIAEVDESDKSHELYGLNYAILTNLEQDHVENYHSLDDLETSFRRFVRNLRRPGLVVYSSEDTLSEKILSGSGQPCLRTGFTPDCDFSAERVSMTPFGSEFDLLEAGFFARRVRLSVPGRHNIANGLLCIGLLVHMGFDLDQVCEILSNFKGARRRLEMKGAYAGVTIVDDYAHHPTEVRAAITALKSMGKNITVVFQPHRFSRTAFFYKQFAATLAGADQVIVTDIHAAGEKDPGDVHAGMIFEELRRLGHPDLWFLPRCEILPHLESCRSLKGVVAFLGAGNIGGVADEFACRLKNVAAA